MTFKIPISKSVRLFLYGPLSFWECLKLICKWYRTEWRESTQEYGLVWGLRDFAEKLDYWWETNQEYTYNRFIELSEKTAKKKLGL